MASDFASLVKAIDEVYATNVATVRGRPCGSTCVLPCQRMGRERTDATAAGNQGGGSKARELNPHSFSDSSVDVRQSCEGKFDLEEGTPRRSGAFYRYRQSARAGRSRPVFICPPAPEG